jgi:hypothetical protein
MPDYVRVKDKSTGHRFTVLAAEAENNPDAYQVLKQDAVNVNGDPLEPEYATATNSGQKADTKESA